MNQNQSDFDQFESLCGVLQGETQFVARDEPIYIFGAGGFGQGIARILKKKNCNVVGFIETSSANRTVEGLPVISWGDIDASELSAQLLVGIYNRDVPFDGLKALAINAGFNKIFMPWDIYSSFEFEMGWKYWLSSKETILDAVQDIKHAHNILSDDESKKTLLNICRFRLGVNDSYASFSHEEDQYFNSLTLKRFEGAGKCSYIDCGAFNGDTYVEAVKLLPVSSAYLFEPDPVNFLQLVEMVKDSTIEPVCLPLAVSNHYQIFSFSGGGEGGAISDEGANHIAAVSLDQMLPNAKVDFIKLDVEGAELHALLGAKTLIERSRPTLVLSLYHRPSDLWLLPILLSEICHNYKFYIRQHFYNSFDSVLYAIPE